MLFEPVNIDFRDANPQDAAVLSELAIKSKAHWGYSKELLDLWRSDLRIESKYIETEIVRTIWMSDKLIGFFAIKRSDVNLLDHLWLLPDVIGRGIGSRAFKEVKTVCVHAEIDEFYIVSDPDAEGFYLRQGAIRVGEVESIPQNRWLPKLRYKIP